ncbi:MAG: putative anti-sigma factor [Bryobacterales bacterium]|nr:putative anti-sigma factor [Bryobacterales bacterium]
MTCDLARPFLEAYIDRELDAPDSLHIEEHLKACNSCSGLQERIEALGSAIRAGAPRYRAPDALRKRIQSDLRSPMHAATLGRKHLFDWRWAAIAASVLVSAIAVWQMPLRPHREQESLIAREIVSSHVRSLMTNHLVDQPSSDQHAVKPWFSGKLDFSPTVKNLDTEGFTLAGGRLDYLDNRPVGAVIYRRRKHILNLFVWPSSQSSDESRHSSTTKGFNTVAWRTDGMQFWAISDLNEHELDLFSRLISQTDKE